MIPNSTWRLHFSGATCRRKLLGWHSQKGGRRKEFDAHQVAGHSEEMIRLVWYPVINSNKQYLSDGMTLQKPAAGYRCLSSCYNPTPLWVTIIVGVIPLTDRMNLAQKKVLLNPISLVSPAISLIIMLTLQRRSRALAMHSNCLSPTEKFSPFSITSESSFIGSWATCVEKKRQKS